MGRVVASHEVQEVVHLHLLDDAEESMGGGRVGFSQLSARSSAARSVPIDILNGGERRAGRLGVGGVVASHEVQEVVHLHLLGSRRG